MTLGGLEEVGLTLRSLRSLSEYLPERGDRRNIVVLEPFTVVGTTVVSTRFRGTRVHKKIGTIDGDWSRKVTEGTDGTSHK